VGRKVDDLDRHPDGDEVRRIEFLVNTCGGNVFDGQVVVDLPGRDIGNPIERIFGQILMKTVSECGANAESLLLCRERSDLGIERQRGRATRRLDCEQFTERRASRRRILEPG
jgi:hypothetical protein